MKLTSRYLCLVVLMWVWSSCSAQSQDGNTPTTQSYTASSLKQSKDKVWVEDTNKLYVRMPDGSAHLLALSQEHQGFYDPQMSPNSKWVLVRTIHPNDIAGTKVSERQSLIEISTGEQIDRYDVAEKLGIGGKGVHYMEWVQGKPATLKLSATINGEAIKTEIEVPDSL